MRDLCSSAALVEEEGTLLGNTQTKWPKLQSVAILSSFSLDFSQATLTNHHFVKSLFGSWDLFQTPNNAKTEPDGVPSTASWVFWTVYWWTCQGGC